MGSIPDRQLRILEKEKITCRDIKTVMGDYADDELMPSLKGRLDAHMDDCTKCRKFKDEYLATIELAKTLKPAPITLDVQNRLRAALNKRLGLQLNPVPTE